MNDMIDFANSLPKKEKDKRPDNCVGCGYHTTAGECRRHSPHPGNDEEYVVTVWNYTKPTDRCGAGSALNKPVSCDDCLHWYQPGGKHLWPDYRMGLPNEWWQQSGLCTANPPGATAHEGMLTFWRVTSMYQLRKDEVRASAPPTPGGCGDGTSVTEMREAAERKAAKKAEALAKKQKRTPPELVLLRPE